MHVNTYYEHQYNTRVGVDNVPELIEKWAQDSQAARESLPCHLDVNYGTANRETLDLFTVADSTRWLVFIHGGYWRAFGKESFSFLAVPFVKAGYNVAMVEYDLCPNISMATLVEQCRRGTAWLAHHARDYGGACESMIIAGHSAGGHLTGMMFATKWADYGMDAALIRGGIGISSLFDLDPIAQTERNEALKLDVQAVAALSPARLLPQVDAPLVPAVGERESDEFHRQNRLLRGIPQWQAITTEIIDVADANHFDILDDFMNLDGAIWSALPR